MENKLKKYRKYLHKSEAIREELACMLDLLIDSKKTPGILCAAKDVLSHNADLKYQEFEYEVDPESNEGLSCCIEHGNQNEVSNSVLSGRIDACMGAISDIRRQLDEKPIRTKVFKPLADTADDAMIKHISKLSAILLTSSTVRGTNDPVNDAIRLTKQVEDIIKKKNR